MTRPERDLLAQSWNGLALVNVHALSGVDVFEEADLVAGKLRRTLLARMTPGSPDGRATQLLGADNT